MSIRRTNRRAFTLLEVLIGVLVLAIALLGLAALFPVIVREQRIAREGVLGVSVARSAEASLTGNNALLSHSPNSAWVMYAKKIATDTNKNRWQVSLVGDAVDGNSKSVYNGSNVSLPCTLAGNVNGRFVIKEEDRLSVSQNLADPALVWDVAACLANDQVVPGVSSSEGQEGIALPTSMPVRVALFVRRVDPRIRVLPSQTLMNVIKQPGVYAVGVDARGFPNLEGTGAYSRPLYMKITDVLASVNNGPLNILVLDPTNATTGIQPQDLVTMVKQSGQKLVDNSGNIFTVLSFDSSANNYNIKVEGMVPTSVQQQARAGKLEVVFTPQIPAAVRTMVIRP